MNQVLHTHEFPNGSVLEIVHGDITQEEVGAIVNAANANLSHGGGVAGIIARKAGRVLRKESRAWVKEHGPVPHEAPAYTSAGNLPCEYVIHAVGPVWGSGDEDHKLTAAVNGSLERADELGLTSISLPAISTGIFGFPKERAARVIYRAAQRYFEKYPDSTLQQVRMTLYDQPTLDAFTRVFRSTFAD